MKLISSILLLLVLSISADAGHFYSRDLAEKYIADSLRAIDSVRVADSMRVAQHIADSLMIERYRTADKEIKNEKIKKEKELEVYKPVDIDSSERIIPDEVDNISARTIVIDKNNQYSTTIDSLQNKVDSIYSSIYDHDSWYKNMKMFPLSEKKRYMIYLLQNKMKDTTAIMNCCNQMYQMYQTRITLLSTIRNSQVDNNNKSFMTNQIEKVKAQLSELSNFMVALSSRLPSLPQHQTGAEVQ